MLPFSHVASLPYAQDSSSLFWLTVPGGERGCGHGTGPTGSWVRLCGRRGRWRRSGCQPCCTCTPPIPGTLSWGQRMHFLSEPQWQRMHFLSEPQWQNALPVRAADTERMRFLSEPQGQRTHFLSEPQKQRTHFLLEPQCERMHFMSESQIQRECTSFLSHRDREHTSC